VSEATKESKVTWKVELRTGKNAWTIVEVEAGEYMTALAEATRVVRLSGRDVLGVARIV
jgi:hypothetical protein